MTLFTGYQKELKYMRNDGSYSAFGMNDPSGSTWYVQGVYRCISRTFSFHISTGQPNRRISLSILQYPFVYPFCICMQNQVALKFSCILVCSVSVFNIITTLFVNSHNTALGLIIFKETSIYSSEVSQNDIFYSFCWFNCLIFHGHRIKLFWFQVDRICFKVFCGDSQNVA